MYLSGLAVAAVGAVADHVDVLGEAHAVGLLVDDVADGGGLGSGASLHHALGDLGHGGDDGAGLRALAGVALEGGLLLGGHDALGAAQGVGVGGEAVLAVKAHLGALQVGGVLLKEE